MPKKFNEQAQKALVIAESIAFDLGHNNVGSEHLLLSLLKMSDSKLKKILKKFNVDYKQIYDDIVGYCGINDSQPFYIEYNDNVNEVIERATNMTVIANKSKVSLKVLTISLLQQKDCLALDLLKKYHVEAENIIEQLQSSSSSSKLSQLIKENKLESCLSEVCPKNEKVILERDKEVFELMCALLCLDKGNVALLGEPGVGKTAIIEELARFIKYEHKGALEGYSVLSLNLGSAISGTKYRGEYEEKITNAINIVSKEKCILFIDEAHSMMKDNTENSMQVSDILKPYLARQDFKCVIATTSREYNKYISIDGALTRRFKKLEICEPQKEKVFKMVSNKIKLYEKYHSVKISKNNVDKLINKLSDVKDRYFPDKLLDVIDYTMSYTKLSCKKKFDEEFAIKYIESMKPLNDETKEGLENDDIEVNLVAVVDNRVKTDIKDNDDKQNIN